MVPLPNPNSIFWGGYGGSLVIIDMDAKTSFGYAMNKMAPTTTGDMRARLPKNRELLNKIYQYGLQPV